MNSFLHAISAEWIKGRRSFLRYSPLMFAFVTLIILLPLTLKDIASKPLQGTFALGFTSTYFIFWTFMVLPMYCILVAILNFYIEHTQGLWKHINAQPVSGVVQALVKHFYGWYYLIIATITFFMLIVFSLFLVKIFNFNLVIGLSDPDYWRTLCLLCIKSLAGGMAIVAILNVLAARLPGFGVTMVVGFIGLILPIFINATDEAAPLIPWAIGKAWTYPLIFDRTAHFQAWWIIIPFVWIGACLAIHCALQKKQPFY